MISSRLVKAIEQEAHRLASDLVASVRQDRRATAYENLSDAQFEGVVLDLYSNLGQWLHSRTWHRLQQVYERKGRERFHGGIPLEQLIFSLTRTKTMLLEFIRGSMEGDGSERDLELELILSVSEFFDRAIYHTVCGYQDARISTTNATKKRFQAAPKPASDKGSKPTKEQRTATSGYDNVSRGGTLGEVSG